MIQIQDRRSKAQMITETICIFHKMIRSIISAVLFLTNRCTAEWPLVWVDPFGTFQSQSLSQKRPNRRLELVAQPSMDSLFLKNTGYYWIYLWHQTNNYLASGIISSHNTKVVYFLVWFYQIWWHGFEIFGSLEKSRQKRWNFFYTTILSKMLNIWYIHTTWRIRNNVSDKSI